MWCADICWAYLHVRACWLILCQTEPKAVLLELSMSAFRRWLPFSELPLVNTPAPTPRGQDCRTPVHSQSSGRGQPPTGGMETSQLPLRGLPASSQMQILESWYWDKRSNTVIKLPLMTWILHAIYLRSSEMNHAPWQPFCFPTRLPSTYSTPGPHWQGHQLLLAFLSDVEATETIFLFHVVQ